VVVRVKDVEENKISLTMKGLAQNQKYWEGEKGKQEGGFGLRGGRPRENDNRRHGSTGDRRPRRNF